MCFVLCARWHKKWASGISLKRAFKMQLNDDDSDCWYIRQMDPLPHPWSPPEAVFMSYWIWGRDGGPFALRNSDPLAESTILWRDMFSPKNVKRYCLSSDGTLKPRQDLGASRWSILWGNEIHLLSILYLLPEEVREYEQTYLTSTEHFVCMTFKF